MKQITNWKSDNKRLHEQSRKDGNETKIEGEEQ